MCVQFSKDQESWQMESLSLADVVDEEMVPSETVPPETACATGSAAWEAAVDYKLGQLCSQGSLRWAAVPPSNFQRTSLTQLNTAARGNHSENISKVFHSHTLDVQVDVVMFYMFFIGVFCCMSFCFQVNFCIWQSVFSQSGYKSSLMLHGLTVHANLQIQSCCIPKPPCVN